MKPSDELLAQRDAVLFGTHVRRAPRSGTDEACLVERCGGSQIIDGLSLKAVRVLRLAVASYRNHTGLLFLIDVNDDEWLTTAETVEVLDLAATYAKEAGL